MLGGTARVLVVDDDVLVLAQIVDALSSGRFALVTTASGADAIAHLALQPFDLILSDLQMPGMDGFELRKRVRAEPRTAAIPFCFVTASVRDEDKARARELGARAFLRKPVHGAKLLAFVNEIVAETGAADRRRLEVQVIARRLGTLGVKFRASPDGTLLMADIPLPKGRLVNSITRAPIPSVAVENFDHEQLRITEPVHMSTLAPIPIVHLTNYASLEQAIIDAYHVHVRVRKKQKAILESWRIETEYDDAGCRFFGRLKAGRDEITFTAIDDRTLRLLSATGRILGARSRDLDVKDATSSVEILHAIEEALRSLPVVTSQAAAPPPPPLALPDLDTDEPPPLVGGYADPEPIELGEPLLEEVLVIDAFAPVGGLTLLCSVCGRAYSLPDEVDDDRLLMTCERCL